MNALFRIFDFFADRWPRPEGVIVGRIDPKKEAVFLQEWGDLATYNAEVARGIQHTPEYDERMKAKQTAYNKWILARAKAEGHIVIGEEEASA